MNNTGCKSGSNNVYYDFPPLMNDGRNFTEWLPGEKLNDNIRKHNNITSNNDYRKYLTKNADSVIKYNQLQACDECCSNINFIQNKKTSNTPFLYKSCYKKETPTGYETSDLKEEYLTRNMLQSRLVTPVFSQNQLLLNGFQNYH